MKHLTTNEVAERFNVTVQTVKLWRRIGRGPKFLKLGKSIRYRESDIKAFEDDNESR